MNEIGTSLIRSGRCSVSNLSFVAVEKNYFGKFSAEKKREQIMFEYP